MASRKRVSSASDDSMKALSSSSVPAPSKAFEPLSFMSVFIVLGIVRLLGTLWFQLVGDCDQTYNYEEPTHFLLYGRGLQTWEYAPQFALRSYAYTGLHAVIGLLVGAAWGADKIAVFHRIHCVLSLACAAAEALFVTGVAHRFGRNLAILTAACLICSAGMLHAAPSYLPSTFTMVGLTAAWGLWLRGSGQRLPSVMAVAASPLPAGGGSSDSSASRYGLLHAMVAVVVIALVMGWPFAIVAVIPLGLRLLVSQPLIRLVGYGAVWLGASCALCAAIDYGYYRALLLAPWNIIKYNALGVGGGGQGSDLYGVEPADFYARNLFLNFNVQAIAAALSPLAFLGYCLASVSSLPRGKWLGVFSSHPLANPDSLTLLSQLWLWFFLMSARPHKEERFLFVVFPIVSFAAAFTLIAASQALGHAMGVSAPAEDAAEALGRRKKDDDGATAATKTTETAAASEASAGEAANILWATKTSPTATTLSVFLTLRSIVILFFLGVSALLTASRIAAQVIHFSAPFHAWTAVGRHLAALDGSAASRDSIRALPYTDAIPGYSSTPSLSAYGEPTFSFSPPLGAAAEQVVCVGKEWYRFPSHFFLLEGKAKLGFLKSGFGGQLPQMYAQGSDATSVNRTGFNDENREEAEGRYVSLDDCDYVVDFLLPTPREEQDGRAYEPYFDAFTEAGRGDGEASKQACACDPASATSTTAAAKWVSVWSMPFLHAESSSLLSRVFFIPGMRGGAKFGTYHVLQKYCGGCNATDGV